MGTNYLAPTWRMPENTNKDKLSNYSIDTAGTSTGIDCGSMADLFGTASVTYNTSYSIWIKPEFDYNTGTYQTFFGNFASGNNAVLLYYQIVDDKWRFLVGDGVGFQFIESNAITSNEELGKGEWQHHCVVFDTVNNNAYYYINNQQINSSTSITKKIATTGDFYIGKKWDLSTGTFTGQVSQGCIFNYALSTDQRTYLYNLNNPMAISGAEPIAYWPLGDNSNPTATAGYPNISVGADSVFDFGTSNEEIDAPGPYADGTQGNLTISAWVKQDAITSSYRPFVCTGFTTSMTQPQIAMAVRNVSGNRLYLFYNGGGGSNYIYAQNVMTEANRWYHCAFVRSGNTGKLYVDGQEVLTQNSANFSINPAVTTADSEMTLGGWRYSGSNESLNGELSNVCLWDKALTDGPGGEIEELYNNGTPLLNVSEIPANEYLKAWYKLNQSAVLTPGITASPWAVSVATGNPDYSSGDDGAYTLNGEFRCRDTGAYDFSDSFYLTFRTITGAHSNITLTSTGGYLQTDGGIRFEYRIDGGSWVQFQEVDGPDTDPWTFTPPSSVNCSTSYELRAQMHGSAYSGSYISLYDMTISASSGTLLTETFGQTNYTGAYGGSISTPPPVTISADHWDIPDNRSAYPQSMEVTGGSSGGKIVVNDFFSDGTTALNGFNFTPVPVNTAGDKYAVCTISWWQKMNYNPTVSATYKGIFDFASQYNTLQVNYSHPNMAKIYLTLFNISRIWQVAGTGADVDVSDQKWHHYCLLIPDTATNATARLFVDNNELSGTGGGGAAAGYPMQRLQIGTGIRTTDSDFSNVQVFNSILSDPQVETLYNNGVPLTTAIATDNLKAWYKLDNNDVWNPVLNQWEIIDYAN